MALIDELHERRKILSDSCDEMRASLRQTEAEIDDLTVAIWALEGTTEEEGRALQTEATAIAALTPAPDFTAEQETAREQLEREPEEDWTNGGENHLDAACAELLADDDTPAIEPESGLHEERPALNEAMQDEREEPVALAQPEWNEPEAHIQAVEAERYALATNPEADFWSRGLASDQKPQSRFNIFGIKPKVDA